YGYPDNDPLANPQKYTPARLIPTREETERFVHDFTAGVEEGANILRDGGSAARSASEPAPASAAGPAAASEAEPATRPVLRKSLDFSPKALGRDRASGPRRSGGPVVDGVRAWAKKLRGEAATASVHAPDADASSAGD
ncbi:hypothetical protein RND15_49900, partial [Streptomyces sp. DSM 41529]|nr:hypothetical protein [Streptomyces sp. DSM 41529]